MNTTTLNRLGLAFGAAALTASAASAQTITPLIVEGDVIANGTVTATYNMDVNNSGEWLVELDTDNVDQTIDNAVVFNGNIIHQEGTSMGFPGSHTSWAYDSYVDSMDVNDNGDRLVLFNVKDINAVLPSKKLILWTSGTTGMTYPILEEGVTPCTIAGEPVSAVWNFLTEVWQNNNNTIVLAGTTDSDNDDIMAVIVHDGAGTILSQTSFFTQNVVHSTAYPGSTGTHADTVQTSGFSKTHFGFNDAGQKMFFVDDQSFGTGGTPDYTAVDSHYYIDLQEIAWENDDAPTAGAWPFNHLSSAEVDINSNGDWLASWDDDNTDTTLDGFILVNGALFVQEGDPAMVGGGFVLEGVNFNNAGARLTDSGDVVWTAEWNDPDTTKDKGLYLNFDLLVQEGVTMIGGVAVNDIRTSQGGDDMAVSNNGRFIIKELELVGGLEGAYMIEIPLADYYCFGDGSAIACPCGNNGAAGEGCANSGLSGSTLEVTGSISIGAASMVLKSSQSVPGQTGIFFQGNVNMNGGLGIILHDGIRCAGGNIIRLQTRVADAFGNAETTVNVATTGAVSAGDTRFYQWWYRDPAGPCSAQSNLSNAAAVQWDI